MQENEHPFARYSDVLPGIKGFDISLFSSRPRLPRLCKPHMRMVGWIWDNEVYHAASEWLVKHAEKAMMMN